MRRVEADLFTLSEVDVSNAEDVIKALKPMKDVTTLVSEESSPTVCLIAPLHAQLIQNTKDSTGESLMVQEIRQAINRDLSKRYTSEEKQSLHRKLMRQCSSCAIA